MALSRSQFNALVERLETVAQSQPRAYRRRVLLLALLGYGYVLALLIALLTLLAGTLALSAAVSGLYGLAFHAVIAVVAFNGGVILKALWVRIEAPQGIALRRRDAPDLFERVDALRRQLEAPRLHRVLIDGEFNAGVVQVPLLGLFGWHRNYLQIGMPFLKTLTPVQLEAVLAHELGHLAGGHGRAMNWVYRLRLAWARLHHEISTRRHWGSFAVVPFFDWYEPYFAAYSFPLARMQEYEADAASARLTSPRTAAEALSSIEVIGKYLADTFWPGIHRRAYTTPKPGVAPYAQLGTSLGTAIRPEEARVWLERALARPATSDDTHPSLADRLRSLGERAQLSLPGEGDAAGRLLGESLARITDELDRRWLTAIEEPWAEAHRNALESKTRLERLNARLAGGEELPVREALEQINLDEELGSGPTAVLERLRTLHAREPDHAGVCLTLGMRLLQQGSPEAIALIEHAMALDETAVGVGSYVLSDWHWSQGNREEADRWHDRMAEATAEDVAAQEERHQLTMLDRLDPHGLGEEELAALRESLAKIEGIRTAWLARKRCERVPERPGYVLGFSCTASLRFFRKRRALELQRRILEQAALPADTLVFCTDGLNYRFEELLGEVEGARLL